MICLSRLYYKVMVSSLFLSPNLKCPKLVLDSPLSASAPSPSSVCSPLSSSPQHSAFPNIHEIGPETSLHPLLAHHPPPRLKAWRSKGKPRQEGRLCSSTSLKLSSCPTRTNAHSSSLSGTLTTHRSGWLSSSQGSQMFSFF